MYLIGKIERCAADRYIDDFALGRDHIDAVLKQIDANPIEKIAAAAGAFVGGQKRAQLVDFSLVGLIAAAAFLVAPMRRDAAFGVGMHVVRADLNLDRLLAG